MSATTTANHKIKNVDTMQFISNIINGRFPSVESCERLVGAIVMEISENWMADPVYLNVAKN